MKEPSPQKLHRGIIEMKSGDNTDQSKSKNECISLKYFIVIKFWMEWYTNVWLLIYVSDKGRTHAMSTRQSRCTPAILSQGNEGTDDDETRTNYSGTTEEYSIP